MISLGANRLCTWIFFIFAASFIVYPGLSFSQVGSPDKFDIATWNIEWFGSNSNGPTDVNRQLENVRTIIQNSGIEFWALQEIVDLTQFNVLVESLGSNWVGQLATISWDLHIGFLYNTDVVREGNPVHILTDKDFAGRPPLRLTVDVTLPDSSFKLTIITVHMKCCSGSDNRDRREHGAFWLKEYMDVALPSETAVILLGDLNDELRFSISGGQITPYQNFLDDPQNYFFASTENDSNREYSFCWNNGCATGSTLDHILISDELFSHLIDNRAYRLDKVLDSDPKFVTETSDHIPVYARFEFSTSTATEAIAETPGTFRIQTVYPNPARNVLNIALEGVVGHPALSAEVFDVLGRKVATPASRSSASSKMQLDTSRLTPGLYILRVSNGREIASVSFVRER